MKKRCKIKFSAFKNACSFKRHSVYVSGENLSSTTATATDYSKKLLKVRSQRNGGFTFLELLVVMSLMTVMFAIAMPHFSSFKGRMRVSDDARRLATTLSQLRAEAIRLRTSVRVEFQDQSISWDIFDDATDDGSLTFDTATNWQGSLAPNDFVFNGLGLVRGVAASGLNLTLDNRGERLTVNINQNGYIDL